jgi:hypothetical protein
MQWLSKLFKKEEIVPESEQTVLQRIGAGKHVIRIMIQQQEYTLVLNDEEFSNGILRGKNIVSVPREEE